MSYSRCTRKFSLIRSIALAALTAPVWLAPLAGQAMPVFARQTAMQCATCHAGGQFPELTPFGRNFKLTGYTLGQRLTVPLAVMGVVSRTSTNDIGSGQVSAEFAKDASVIFQTGSLLFGGKITNNIGMFGQITYENYDHQDPTTFAWKGHSHADNIDLRYARQWKGGGHDFVSGLSLNNNPTVSDIWNTAPAWIAYVPTAFGFTGPAAEPLVATLGQQLVGLSAYSMFDNMLYAEVAGYHSPKGVFKVLTEGNELEARVKGVSPYVRVALNQVWGDHNAMIGLFGLNANIYQDPVAGGPTTAYRDRGIDAQYQYLAGVHTATAQLSYIREKIRGGDRTGFASNASDTLRQLRVKGSYIHGAKVGGSLTWFNTTGSSDATLYPASEDDGSGNLVPIPLSGSIANNPGTRGWIPEVFWIPHQQIRIGAQFFKFKRYNGSSNNYDGTGRNARGNDTLFIYLWVAG